MKFATFYKKIISILLLISFTLSPIAAFAQTMTSGSYSIQSDSMNFGGGRSTSGSYSLENTSGEVGTGNLSGTSNGLTAGYQQADTVAQATPTPSPEDPQSTSSSGGRAAIPTNVLHFKATSRVDDIQLSWMYPAEGNVSSVRIIRSDKFFPGDINDGEVIYEGNGNIVLDKNVETNKTYYYAIFALGQNGKYSSGVLAQAKIVPAGTIPTPVTADDIFKDVPDAPNVDPIIAKLTLLDFDFIQNGRDINPINGFVAVDGSENLTVRLAYDKVPEVLKTIAVTLTDPEDSTSFFTFLLRINEDKTAYEATIAPLGRSGNYKLNIIVLDYQNQGLKRLDGVIKALAFEEAKALLSFNGNNKGLIYMISTLFILALILVIFIVIRERKKKVALSTNQIQK